MKPRPNYMAVWKELAAEKSMVFISGPRQVGKTTLAKSISQDFVNHLYFNWDIPADRAKLIENPAFFETLVRKDPSLPLVVFDEIHKYKDWKNYLKGAYDRFYDQFRFLVTGSGRLDTYQKGGDSLVGRYYLFHLWPFTIGEISGQNRRWQAFANNPLNCRIQENKTLKASWDHLSTYSGFPEPFLAAKPKTWQRWSNTYGQQLIREDIRDLTQIRSINDMETLFYLLPSKIGSRISITAIARDLKLSYNTVRDWLGVFERFFMTFSIGPWTARISRAIQKERKIYLWDSPRIQDKAARLENMVALELYRATTLWNDVGYGRFSLHFIKNKEQQEIDFLIAESNTPKLLIEVKVSETHPSPALLKFQRALKIPAIQLFNQDSGFRLLSNNYQKILVAPAWQWLATLPW
jgi:predicted AAA+ superfamily ATPase